MAKCLENKIPGIRSVVRDANFDDDKYRSGGIRLNYETCFPIIPGLKEGILLELGFDRTAPHQAKTITSWVLEKAISSKVTVIENRARDVLCYEPKYTFVEKLQAIVRKFRLYQETGTLPGNFLRHYYDIHCLLKLKEVADFIGTSEYEAYKKERFGGDDVKVANSEAFRLNQANDFHLFQREYVKSRSLYYKGQIGFKEILASVEVYLDRL